VEISRVNYIPGCAGKTRCAHSNTYHKIKEANLHMCQDKCNRADTSAPHANNSGKNRFRLSNCNTTRRKLPCPSNRCSNVFMFCVYAAGGPFFPSHL
jgi:hypothetical protein